jgi:hypothetical protein
LQTTIYPPKGHVALVAKLEKKISPSIEAFDCIIEPKKKVTGPALALREGSQGLVGYLVLHTVMKLTWQVEESATWRRAC